MAGTGPSVAPPPSLATSGLNTRRYACHTRPTLSDSSASAAAQSAANSCRASASAATSARTASVAAAHARHSRSCRCGAGGTSPDAGAARAGPTPGTAVAASQVSVQIWGAAVSPVPVQMRQRRAESQGRCGRSDPSPGAHVAECAHLGEYWPRHHAAAINRRQRRRAHRHRRERTVGGTRHEDSDRAARDDPQSRARRRLVPVPVATRAQQRVCV